MKPVSRRPTVCLFSIHPLLGPEFRRSLSDEEFRLLFRRVDADVPLDPSKLPIPRASVYVVEAHPRREVTEGLVSTVLEKRAGARVVVIAEKMDEAEALPLLRLGTKGLLTYLDVTSQLPRAIHTVAEGGFWVPRSLLSRFVEATLKSRPRSNVVALAASRRLSQRETQVLELLLKNFSNKEIARELQFSQRTAKFHVSNLLAKHGVRRRADLILLAHTPAEP